MSNCDELLKAREEWVKRDGVLLKEGETPQLLLRYKESISYILEKRNKDSYHFVRNNGGQFGFSERLVNQLMKFAYERGQEIGRLKGHEEGYDSALKEVARKLGFDSRDE